MHSASFYSPPPLSLPPSLCLYSFINRFESSVLSEFFLPFGPCTRIKWKMPREHRGEPYHIRPFFFPQICRLLLSLGYFLLRELDPCNFRIHRSCIHRRVSTGVFERLFIRSVPARVEDTRMCHACTHEPCFPRKDKGCFEGWNDARYEHPDFPEFHFGSRIPGFNIITRTIVENETVEYLFIFFITNLKNSP